MSTDDHLALSNNSDPSLKQEFDRIMTGLKENPLSIKVESSEYLYHPSDYVDSRVSIAFVGDYAYLAGLLTEFWSGTSIKPIVLTNLTTESQSVLHQASVDFQRELQAEEIDEYRVKIESSPLGGDLSDEDIEQKINDVLDSGDKTRLLVNSKSLSTNEFARAGYEGTDAENIIKALEQADVDQKVKVIFFVSKPTSPDVVSFTHPTIPTVSPELPALGCVDGDETKWSRADLTELLTFVQSLPAVVELFL